MRARVSELAVRSRVGLRARLCPRIRARRRAEPMAAGRSMPCRPRLPSPPRVRLDRSLTAELAALDRVQKTSEQATACPERAARASRAPPPEAARVDRPCCDGARWKARGRPASARPAARARVLAEQRVDGQPLACRAGHPGVARPSQVPVPGPATGAGAVVVDPGAASVERVLSERGERFELSVRRRMEPRFGVDLGGVTVHTGPAAAAAAAALDAHAFALGGTIVFGEGAYAPETTAGRRTLAHELAHVVQNGGEPVRGPFVLGSESSPASSRRVGWPSASPRLPTRPVGRSGWDRCGHPGVRSHASRRGGDRRRPTAPSCSSRSTASRTRSRS